MSSFYPKVRGMRNDKRTLLETNNRIVIFGEGVKPPDYSQGKGRRLLQRGPTRQTRRSSKSKSVTVPVSAVPNDTIADRFNRKFHLTDYFSNTKPWNNVSKKIIPLNDEPLLERTSMSACCGDTNPHEINSNHLTKLVSHEKPRSSKTPSSAPEPTIRKSEVFVDSLACPICLKTFNPPSVPPGDLMKHSKVLYQLKNNLAKKSLEDNWGNEIKKYQLNPEDVVVVASCGELFHKMCLREWCSRAHKSKVRKHALICPSCGGELKFTASQDVEINKSFGKDTSLLIKEYYQALHVNKELNLLYPETNKYLEKVREEIKASETNLNDLRKQRHLLKENLQTLTEDDLGVVMSTMSNAKTLRDSLIKQDQALEFMRQETLRIMRMYLHAIIKKLKPFIVMIPKTRELKLDPDFVTVMGRIPIALAPYLDKVVQDDQALSLLSRILVPLDDEDVKDRKAMEEALVAKYSHGRPLEDFVRAQTYVAISSAQEVGETEEEEAMRQDVNSSKSFQLTDENALDLSLRASTASHEFSQLSSTDLPNPSILEADTVLSSVVVADKPPKLFDVLDMPPEALLLRDFPRPEEKGIRKLSELDKKEWGQNKRAETRYPMNPSSGEVASDERESLQESLIQHADAYEHNQDTKYVRTIRNLLGRSSKERTTEKQASDKAAIPQEVLRALMKASKPNGLSQQTPNATNQSSQPSTKTVENTDAQLAEPNVDQLFYRNLERCFLPQTSSTTSERNPITDEIIALVREQQQLGRTESAFTPEYNVLEFEDKLDGDLEHLILSTNPPALMSNSTFMKIGNGESFKKCELNATDDDKLVTFSEVSSSNDISQQDGLCRPNNSPINEHDPVRKLAVENSDALQLQSEASGLDPKVSSEIDRSLPENKVVEDVCITIMYVIDGNDDEELVDSGNEGEPIRDKRNKIVRILNNNDSDSQPADVPSKDLSCVHLTAGKTSHFSILTSTNATASTPKDSSQTVEELPSWACPNGQTLTNSSLLSNSCTRSENNVISIRGPLLRLSNSLSSFQLPSKSSRLMPTNQPPIPTCIYENEKKSNSVKSFENKKVTGN